MKPKIRTSEWLAAARRLAGLSQVELAKLAGLKSTIIVSLFETGAQVPSSRTWKALEDALRTRVPLMFVDEDGLIAILEAGMCLLEDENALCRLSYVPCKQGVAFTEARLVQGEPPADPFITVPIAEALGLLKVQKTWFGSSCGESQEGKVGDSRTDCEGAKLREMRRALGLGQRDVARMLSISQPSISHLERGTEKSPALARRYRDLLEQMTAKASD